MTRSVALLDGVSFDSDATRLCVPCRTGFACYRGLRNEHGEWKGKLVGVLTNETDVKRFLEGAFVSFSSSKN